MAQDWWGTKIWTRRREVLTPLGFKLSSGVHPAYALMRKGTFEVDETRLLTRLLENADVLVDVGANLGYYTLIALKMGKRVVAFEPQPRNLNALFHNITVNGWQDRAEVFPLALSDRPGLLTLFGASGPSASLVKGWASYSASFRQTVAVSTMDSVIGGGRFAHKHLVVKIDVEGAEYAVLKGAVETLQSKIAPVWVVEICLDEYHPHGANPNFLATFNLFFDNGYEAFTATDEPVAVSRGEAMTWASQGSARSGAFNYLFVKPVST